MNETAVIYARVSSVNDRQDTSRQIRDLQLLAKEKSLKVVEYLRGTYIRCQEDSGKTGSLRVPAILYLKSCQRSTSLRIITSWKEC